MVLGGSPKQMFQQESRSKVIVKFTENKYWN